MKTKNPLIDIDYYNRLPTTAQAWLQVFLRATIGLERDALAILAGQDDGLLRRLSKQVYDEDRARRRDVTYVTAETLYSGGRRKRFPRYSEADYGLSR